MFAHKESIEEISGVASGEYALELQLAKIQQGWKEAAFGVKSYRESKDVFILGGLDDVFAQLDDNQALLQTMLASRFVAGIRQQVEICDKKLACVSETLDEWLQGHDAKDEKKTECDRCVYNGRCALHASRREQSSGKDSKESGGLS